MTERRTIRNVATTGGVTVLLGATLTSGAYAEDTSHCVTSAETGGQECFGSPSEAQMHGLQRDGEVIIGTFFIDEKFGGNSLTVTGPSPCDGDDIDYQLDFPEEWRDSISGLQPWADCVIWLYPEPGLGGDRDGPFRENTPHVGDFMNDRAQSVGFG